MSTNRRWEPWEDTLVRQHYPTGGARAVQAAGVNRTPDAIRSRVRAHKLGNLHDLPPMQAHTLALLSRAYGQLIDSDAPGNDPRSLAALTKRGYAKHLGAGLYRVTLAGLLHYRKHSAPPNETEYDTD